MEAMQGMDPGERRDEMVTGRMELGWASGDRDTAGAAGVMETGMLLPRSRRDAGYRLHQASDQMVKDTCLCPTGCVCPSCASHRNFRHLRAPCW